MDKSDVGTVSFSSVLVDARAFQDPNYQYRGIGRHGMSLLTHLPSKLKNGTRLIALCDPNLPDLPKEYRKYFSDVVKEVNFKGQFVFFCPSPLTHSPDFLRKVLSHRRILLSVAVVLDFIPYDFEGYLSVEEVAEAYFANIELLKKFDYYLPISQFTSERLTAICNVAADRQTVTRVGVRSAFFNAVSAAANHPVPKAIDKNKPFFFTVCGSDIRKNVEVCIDAVGALNGSRDAPFTLAVAGHYSRAETDTFARRATRLCGTSNWLTFLPHISDEDLAACYRHARATIAPSFMEGFSMPVAEAITAGGVVVASNCGAHRELISTEEAIFAPESSAKLVEILQRLISDDALRSDLAKRQAEGLPDIKEIDVAQRAWAGFLKAVPQHVEVSVKRLNPERPRLALFSPYLPQPSGISVYTAQMMRHLSKHADVDLFTEADVPASDRHYFNRIGDYAETIEPAEYDSCIYEIGNNRLYHKSIIDLFLEFGGVPIIHDERLYEYYESTMDRQSFVALCERLLGRPVSAENINEWGHLKNKIPHPFLDEILAEAPIAIVHSKVQQKYIKEKYERDVSYLPFAVYVDFQSYELEPVYRATARESCQITDDIPTIGVFGDVNYFTKGTYEIIFAANELVKWGLAAKVLFVGGCDLATAQQLQQTISSLGLSDYVKLTGSIPQRQYHQHLCAVDAGVQLRHSLFGQVSGALSDCIAAGLPTVANESLAEAINSPDYVVRIPDKWSPVIVAEGMLKALELSKARPRDDEARRDYVDRHSFERYTEGLLDTVLQKSNTP